MMGLCKVSVIFQCFLFIYCLVGDVLSVVLFFYCSVLFIRMFRFSSTQETKTVPNLGSFTLKQFRGVCKHIEDITTLKMGRADINHGPT